MLMLGKFSHSQIVVFLRKFALTWALPGVVLETNEISLKYTQCCSECATATTDKENSKEWFGNRNQMETIRNCCLPVLSEGSWKGERGTFVQEHNDRESGGVFKLTEGRGGWDIGN